MVTCPWKNLPGSIQFHGLVPIARLCPFTVMVEPETLWWGTVTTSLWSQRQAPPPLVIIITCAAHFFQLWPNLAFDTKRTCDPSLVPPSFHSTVSLPFSLKSHALLLLLSFADTFVSSHYEKKRRGKKHPLPWLNLILFLLLPVPTQLNMVEGWWRCWLSSCSVCVHRPEVHLSCRQAITLYSPAYSLSRFLGSQFNIFSSLHKPLILSSQPRCQTVTRVSLRTSPRRRELLETFWASTSTDSHLSGLLCLHLCDTEEL